MPRPLLRILVALLGLLPFLLLASAGEPVKPYTPHVAPASDEPAKVMKRFKLPTGMTAEVWAAEPHLANPVAFCFDEKGRCFVAETFRLHKGVTDDRDHMDWLDDDLASRTVADRVALYKKYLKDKFATYETEHDRVRLIEDTDGDGKADKATVFADGFHHAADGIGAGVLARKGDVYYTCIPDLWRLRDTKGTGIADVRKSLSTGYGIHVGFLGHDLHGLVVGPDGKLYFSIGDRGFNVTTAEGKKLFNPDRGAVLRCDTDGKNLEVVATGLRNPQELAFDDYGNLFTGDNNCDSGDRARWVHVVEGGDSGWCMGYQYDTAMGSRGPWNSEKIWHLPNPDQPACYLPPLAHIGNGPSGLASYPGVGLSEKYAGHFFLCDFRGGGGGSGVWSFALKPRGATFEVTDLHEFVWSILATDCDFGPDGAFYISDWTEGWGLTGKGRIYRFSDAGAMKKTGVGDAKKLLPAGFDKTPVKELVKLLEHPDRRVRQEAQLALADGDDTATAALMDVAEKGTHRLARLHAIWGIGIAATKGGTAPERLTVLLDDKDGEVRAQAAKVVGDINFSPAFEKLIPLLKDSEPRVRFFAAQSLGKAGHRPAVKPLLEMLRANADADVYLRHAGVMALARIEDKDTVLAADRDPSPAVRMGVLLTLRRWESPEVARFLSDTDARLVLEAARAINDVPIEKATDKLAALSTRTGLAEVLWFRVLNANYRLGTAEHAQAVASVAGRGDVPEKIRLEAIKMLGAWAKPHGRDRVMGLWRPLPERPANLATDALRAVLARVFTGTDTVRKEATKVAAALGIKEVEPVLRDLVSDGKRSGVVRAEALYALESLKDKTLADLLARVQKDDDPRVRDAARRVLARRHPADGVKAAVAVLETGATIEKQGAFAILGETKDRTADGVLASWLEKLKEGKVPAEVQLDLLEAAGRRGDGEVKTKLAAFEASRPKSDHLANWREAMEGGDAEAGRNIFFNKMEASCLRCHKVKGEGGEVGPDLTRIAAKQKRDYLLEAIVDPNRQIAMGFESVQLLLTNGKVEVGILKSEDAKEVKLMTAEGRLLTIPKAKIDEREKAKSPMPEDVAKHLTKRELRDLVEFLGSLK